MSLISKYNPERREVLPRPDASGLSGHEEMYGANRARDHDCWMPTSNQTDNTHRQDSSNNIDTQESAVGETLPGEMTEAVASTPTTISVRVLLRSALLARQAAARQRSSVAAQQQILAQPGV
ncbi:hypothetical protein ACO22_06170 [Paracoccidioides brasiliensis]|uniref:Uncharacterized protein n=1 Tax=Paracoccidioides brasiliensis TaxID=121759 RepID=A0A1D2J888_PARBR|nr:hypothetical protein ACO22_06170 [Paracoccidioides brasiliensis]